MSLACSAEGVGFCFRDRWFGLQGTLGCRTRPLSPRRIPLNPKPHYGLCTHCLGVEVIRVALGTLVDSLSYVPRKLLNAWKHHRIKNP